MGNYGDAKSVGGGVSELRIDYGPGYRVYFVERGKVAVILLCGGDKRSQAADIALAQKLSKEVLTDLSRVRAMAPADEKGTLYAH